MKKIISVLLAALMLCSAFSVLSFAVLVFPAPEAPANLALTEDGIASWDAVAVPAYETTEEYAVTCSVVYRVTLSRWDYDTKKENWTFTQVGDMITTAETSVDLSASMSSSGKYIIAVAAVAEYSRTKLPNGTPAQFSRVSATTTMDKADAVDVVYDLFKDPVDTSVPFESMVDEDDEQVNNLFKIIKKIKEIFLIILRFLGYAGDLSGVTEQIASKHS